MKKSSTKKTVEKPNNISSIAGNRGFKPANNLNLKQPSTKMMLAPQGLDAKDLR